MCDSFMVSCECQSWTGEVRHPSLSYNGLVQSSGNLSGDWRDSLQDRVQHFTGDTTL